jgi:hypothetical protein
MDSTAKLLGERYGTTQVTFLRFASGALFAVPLWLWRRTPEAAMKACACVRACACSRAHVRESLRLSSRVRSDLGTPT